MDQHNSLLENYNKNKILIEELKLLKKQKNKLKKPKPKPKPKYNILYTITHISQGIVLIGGLVWGIVSFFDLYNKKKDGSDQLRGMLMGLIGICSIFLIITKGTKPSFIGDYNLPPTALYQSYPRYYDITYELEVDPNTYVIYWAANKQKKIESINNEDVAYGNFENSGVVKSDEYGNCKIYLQFPNRVVTKDIMPRILDRHFFYRTMNSKHGILSDVKKINIEDLCPEIQLNVHSVHHKSDAKELNNYIIPMDIMKGII